MLHEDGSILAVDKPSGLLVHRGEDDDPVTLADLVRAHLGDSTAWPAHRLDRGTSGIVLFARDAAIARALGEALAEGRVHKRYLAIVRGAAPPDGVVDHAIPRREDGPRVPARTRFVRVATMATEPRHSSLVCAEPETGRRHQLRRHLKHAGHPILGDTTYGKAALNHAFAERYGLARLALHAWTVELAHPATGATLRIVAPMPAGLTEPLARMGLGGLPDPEARVW